MSAELPLPPLPITEAATEIAYYERSEAFRSSGELRLGIGFSDPGIAKEFSPPQRTLTIRNFKLTGAHLDTACMLLIKDGRKIPETAYLLPQHHYENAQVLRNQLVELDARVEYVIGCNRDRNYYHWLTQALPAIDWAMRSAKSDNVALMLPELTGWQSASVELLGYANVPRVALVPWHHFYFPHVSYSEFLTEVMPSGISLTALSTFRRLRTLASDRLVPQARIIYVARTDAQRRVAVNEQDLIEVLAAEGVHVIVPGSLSFSEQIARFSQADAVIAPHGAGLSNLVFCKPGTILYEMLPEHYPNYCFSRLAHGAGLHYWADIFPSHGEGEIHDRNWVIDINVVRDRLRDIRMRLAEVFPTRVAASGRSGAMEFLKRNSVTVPDPGVASGTQAGRQAKQATGFISRLLRRRPSQGQR